MTGNGCLEYSLPMFLLTFAAEYESPVTQLLFQDRAKAEKFKSDYEDGAEYALNRVGCEPQWVHCSLRMMKVEDC